MTRTRARAHGQRGKEPRPRAGTASPRHGPPGCHFVARPPFCAARGRGRGSGRGPAARDGRGRRRARPRPPLFSAWGSRGPSGSAAGSPPPAPQQQQRVNRERQPQGVRDPGAHRKRGVSPVRGMTSCVGKLKSPPWEAAYGRTGLGILHLCKQSQVRSRKQQRCRNSAEPSTRRRGSCSPRGGGALRARLPLAGPRSTRLSGPILPDPEA